MVLPKMGTLVMIAGGFGIGTGLMGFLVTSQRDKLTSQSGFVVKAVDFLREQPATKELLGEKLRIGKASLCDGWTKHHVTVKLPIKGELDNAILFAYARRKSDDEKLRLYKLEATFGKIADKRLVLIDRTDQEDPPEEPVKVEASREDEQRTKKERQRIAELSAEEKKRYYIEEMKSWEPQR